MLPYTSAVKAGLFRRQWLPCTARFKTLKGAFWLFCDLIVGLWEVILWSFPLVMWGKGGNASAVEGRELFQLKSCYDVSPAAPGPGPRLLSLAWHMVKIPPKAPFPVSAWHEDTTSKNTVERWWGTGSGSHTHARTCKNSENFVHLPVPRKKKSGVIFRGTWQSFYYKSRFKYIIPSNLESFRGFLLLWVSFSSHALLKEE